MKLSEKIDWRYLEKQFGAVYDDDLRIPTKSDTYSNLKPDGHSDLKPDSGDVISAVSCG
jgi:hypothetical protein